MANAIAQRGVGALAWVDLRRSRDSVYQYAGLGVDGDPHREREWHFKVAMVFLGFVAVAGMAAAVTVEVSSGLPQLIPSVLAMIATTLAHRSAA